MSTTTPPAAPAPAGPCALALSALPGMGPARLHSLIAEFGPGPAWERVLAGREVRPMPSRGTASIPRPWASAARSFDVASAWDASQRRRIQVTWPGDERWPPVFIDDPHPPGVLFWRGDLGALRQPAVAVVGTRRASPEGRSVAFELGFDLARAGVPVVSGLALGIDGAAHAGALQAWESSEVATAAVAPTIGVAATGVDVIYPRRHADLWKRVSNSGVVVSETPPGGAPSSWRFPARNRIIVALSRMVVVVESHLSGGSLITVETALARGVDVRAVPGPVRAPTSAGPNQLLCDGAAPVRHAGDVLDGLGMLDIWPPPPARRSSSGGEHHPLDADAEAVCRAVAWHPTSCGRIVERTGLALGVVCRHLDQLEALGRIIREGDQWSQSTEGGGRAPRPRMPS